jgi:hypothetical protein
MFKILTIILSLALIVGGCAAKEDINEHSKTLNLAEDELQEAGKASPEALYLFNRLTEENSEEITLILGLDAKDVDGLGPIRLTGIIFGKMPKAYIEIGGRPRGLVTGGKIGEYTIHKIQPETVLLKKDIK